MVGGPDDRPYGHVAPGLFTGLVETIAEELRVQIAIGRLGADDGVRRTAALIADALIQSFEIEQRPR